MTRPTLDRVKESLFNIINSKIEDSVVLDLFAGSGAIGIEFLSRGCKKAYLCDKSKEAMKFIKDNINKTKLQENAVVACKDYKDFLDDLSGRHALILTLLKVLELNNKGGLVGALTGDEIASGTAARFHDELLAVQVVLPMVFRLTKGRIDD